jgi:hypothetical protein
MQDRIDYLSAERTNIVRLLAATSQVPQDDNNGPERSRGRMAVLEADLARLDQLIGVMSAGPLTTLERAYELARSGHCVNLADIRRGLFAEGYDDANGQLNGPVLHKDLHRLCDAARGLGPRLQAKPTQSRRTARARRVGR